MTDSETLRAMLKERGIKYKTRDALGACETSWCGYTAYQLTPESKLIMHLTPEQAIAATAGADYGITFASTFDRPHETMVGETVYDSEGNAIGWIANAKVGAGTCRNISDPPNGFLCSECGWGDFDEPTHLLTTAKFTDNDRGPNYCPNCGAKVVSA